MRAPTTRDDRDFGRIGVGLSSGPEASFRTHDIQGLDAAEPDDLATIEIPLATKASTS